MNEKELCSLIESIDRLSDTVITLNMNVWAHQILLISLTSAISSDVHLQSRLRQCLTKAALADADQSLTIPVQDDLLDLRLSTLRGLLPPALQSCVPAR